MKACKTLSISAIVLIAMASALAPAFSGPARTTPTTIDPSGNTVKIDSTVNTVKIDSTANTVKLDSTTAPVKVDSITSPVLVSTTHNQQQFWTSDQVIVNGNGSWSPVLNCAGYKELRIVLVSSMGTANSSLSFDVWTYMGTTSFVAVRGNFGASAHVLSEQSSLSLPAGTAVFTIPVLSDKMRLFIHNNTGSTVKIHNWSYAYLVN